jgi:hypothetical protein
VDDFAVVWSSAKSMQHFIDTLRKLYTIKIDYVGLKYLGINIDVNQKQRHVTLSMPGYIAKLLKRVRPAGVKAASTPSVYSAPNYKKNEFRRLLWMSHHLQLQHNNTRCRWWYALYCTTLEQWTRLF